MIFGTGRINAKYHSCLCYNLSMIIVLSQKATEKQFKKAREVYKDYIKVVIDIEKNIMAVGGEYHIDCEEVLIKSGSRQENLYGGGYRISTKETEYMALSNYKPALSRLTYEISDPKIRNKLEQLIKKYIAR
jgi:hypothetical protein